MTTREPARDPDPEQGFRAEHYFPMGYLSVPFRRKPYAGLTYGEAIDTVLAELWNIAHPPETPMPGMEAAMVRSASVAYEKLHGMLKQFRLHHDEYPNRSQALVHEFSNLWRGPVTVVLTWFRKTEGA